MGLNEVFKKVADIESNATELASHQIELTTVKDIEALVFEARKETIQASNESKRILATIDSIANLYNKSVIKSESALRLINTLKAEVKTLGLDVPSLIITREKELIETIRENRAKFTSISNSKNNFK